MKRVIPGLKDDSNDDIILDTVPIPNGGSLVSMYIGYYCQLQVVQVVSLSQIRHTIIVMN